MNIAIEPQTTVRELVGRCPQTRPVLEKHGIDYCCGGGQTLESAAARQNVSFAMLAAELDQAATAPPRGPTEKDWFAAPLPELVDHIVGTHHAYLRTALPRLRMLIAKVLNAHGDRHGEMLRRVQASFTALDEELSAHLFKEEQVLFPHIVAAAQSTPGMRPMPPFGTVRNPISQMEHEHDSAGAALADLRQATGDYALPGDACPTFRAMYDALRQLESDLHQHIHLENNILFPRAVEME